MEKVNLIFSQKENDANLLSPVSNFIASVLNTERLENSEKSPMNNKPKIIKLAKL